MSYGNKKAWEHFRLRIKAENIQPNEVYYMSGTSGWTIPSGVLIFDTTLSKFKMGTGGTDTETITSTT